MADTEDYRVDMQRKFLCMPDMLHRCGEQHGRFYDRKGDFFREGVDPRNYFGRFVEIESGHDDECPAMYSYAERCNCSRWWNRKSNLEAINA